jgi:hypothetical protein
MQKEINENKANISEVEKKRFWLKDSNG